jgi:hypothetical protein
MTNFVKILPVGAELFHANGRTDKHDEANSRFFAILRKGLKTKKNKFQACASYGPLGGLKIRLSIASH